MQLLQRTIELITYSQLIGAAKGFETASILHSNHYSDQFGKYDWLAAYGVHDYIMPEKNSFAALDQFQQNYDWVFGGLSYDLKNELESLHSKSDNPIGFPTLYFFAPQILLVKKRNANQVDAYISDSFSAEDVDNFFKKLSAQEKVEGSQVPTLTPRLSKVAYLERIGQLKQHIQRGDIYEVNFCQEFYAENTHIDPYSVMEALNDSAPMPFSTFFKKHASFLMGATPERFLCKRGGLLVAQPIKGTLKRNGKAEEEVQNLRNDQKEQNENVMIVDLMRNDLSKVAKRGSVQVAELFGVYTFPKVHQMISTVTAELKETISSIEAIKQAFPMGSMTGAPKVSAMQLIDKMEETRRGWYSGAVGYFDPEGDFDFNVIIRSLQYNAVNQYCSLIVGGAITDQSIPEKEYEECLLKAKSVFNLTAKKTINAR
jgi:para-aminobenzoate synthetase component 1